MDILQSVDPTSSLSSLSDPYRPSFFELFAQEQLRDLLAPALRYVLSVFTQRHPRYLLRIVNRFDELYALAMYAVERHYLKTWGERSTTEKTAAFSLLIAVHPSTGSSFAENFYGLRRRRRPGASTDRAKAAATTRPGQASYEALRNREISLSLLFLVGLPYIQSKAKDRWERMGGGVSEEQLFDNGEELQGRRAFQENEQRTKSQLVRLKEKSEDLFHKGYPYAASFYQLWLLIYHMRYLFGKSPYWRPWLRWMRVDVRRVSQDDYPNSVPILPPDLPHPLREPVPFFTSLIRSSPFIFFELLKYALPASIFFFKFLEWWYSSDNPRRRRGGGDGNGGAAPAQGGFGTNVPLFGPPSVLMPDKEGVLFHKEEGYQPPRVPTKMALAGGMHGPTNVASLLHNSCPLCGRTPVANPCMLPTGYVFCYTCAHAYVDEHGQCPVTRRKVIGGKDSIRRVLG
ncbi:hypothetical protein K437DRAFT_255626 [Tilletiaria anomala UBC 951]|uniref:Peroxisome assembly protein 12 n=1 Tax=Tilletiaria anomala (strain ATCC 24038 / CBS 436.72 / UBC 951) TaxID=1037660 RepID=A0A066W2K2_TILAU|nr:uncharacterized protein K437DRAFT_255626 [Tilletiaria anomala UBC 951]KDN48202.1 hypothetical protein K437DRAFT_255626 [Tilletiaria anomala UBC 951]